MTTLLVGAGGTPGVLARYGISRLAGRAVDYLTPIQLLVLLDEPWSNIDPQLRSLLRDEIAVILREVGVTAVLVTHDREEAFSLADRIALMREGNVIQEGTPEELYVAPSDRWAAEFVGAANFVRGHVEGDVVQTPLGPLPHARISPAADVEVLIRPEQLELRLDPAGEAEVVAREFRGHDVFYRLASLHHPRPRGVRVKLEPTGSLASGCEDPSGSRASPAAALPPQNPNVEAFRRSGRTSVRRRAARGGTSRGC